MSSSTKVVQVTNVSPSANSEHMRTLFGFLGNIDELKLFPPDDSPLPVTSRVCFVKFLESESVGVSQHLTNTVFADRALIVVPFAEGVIPDESKALSLMAPANAVAGMLPGGGLLPTPTPVPSMGGVSLCSMGGPGMDPMAALGITGHMNPQSLSAEQIMKFMASMDPNMRRWESLLPGVFSCLNPLAAGLNLNAGLKTDASSKEIEEAMKRVREAQSLISAAIEPGNKKDDKRKHSRSSSRTRKKRSRSRSKYRRSKSRSPKRSGSRSKRRSKSPRRRRSHSKDKRRHSRSRDRRKRSKTPPKSYSSGRRSCSISRKHQRRSNSISHSPKKSRSPKKRLSRSPSPRRHKKDKKKDKERGKERDRKEDQNQEKRERSTIKKSKDKDKEKERDRKSDGEKSDVKQVIRDYDEEEQGYDSEREEMQERSPGTRASPHADSTGGGDSDQHSDEPQDEDMDMSD